MQDWAEAVQGSGALISACRTGQRCCGFPGSWTGQTGPGKSSTSHIQAYGFDLGAWDPIQPRDQHCTTHLNQGAKRLRTTDLRWCCAVRYVASRKQASYWFRKPQNHTHTYHHSKCCLSMRWTSGRERETRSPNRNHNRKNVEKKSYCTLLEIPWGLYKIHKDHPRYFIQHADAHKSCYFEDASNIVTIS